MVDQEGDDGLGNGVVDVLFDHVEVGNDESLDHVGFGLLPEFGVFVDSDGGGD